MQELEQKLGYIFKNKGLLEQALTRESAIQEKIKGAAKQSYQTLEFVGDAALKHAIARIVVEKLQEKFPQGVPEGMLHDCTKKLIGNENTLPQIADSIDLSKFIIKGKGETNITAKMKADAMEAILGAISLDGQSQENLFYAVSTLWKPQLNKVIAETEKPKLAATIPSPSSANTATSSSTSTATTTKITTALSNKQFIKIPVAQTTASTASTSTSLQPPSPRTQRMFAGTGSHISAEVFSKTVTAVPDVNRKNIGKKGDTALMTLLRKEKLREKIEIPKIEALLQHGALWNTKNNLGESADDLKGKHNEQVISKLKAIKM
jgi:dsRNA-specific ribonuclease